MNTILKRLRLERGMSSRALAASVGVSHVTILRLERGVSTGHPRTRAALARAMGVPVDVLLLPDTKNGDAPKDAAAGVATTPVTTPDTTR
jgi:transcriptional regulator with XRE-family HTH domain